MTILSSDIYTVLVLPKRLHGPDLWYYTASHSRYSAVHHRYQINFAVLAPACETLD